MVPLQVTAAASIFRTSTRVTALWGQTGDETSGSSPFPVSDWEDVLKQTRETFFRPTRAADLRYLQGFCPRREVRCFGYPVQSDAGTINQAGVRRSQERTCTVGGTGAAARAAAGEPRGSDAAQRTQQAAGESKLGETDAMFSLGYSLSISTRHSSLASHRPCFCNSSRTGGKSCLSSERFA